MRIAFHGTLAGPDLAVSQDSQVNGHENHMPSRSNKGKITAVAISKCLGGRLQCCK